DGAGQQLSGAGAAQPLEVFLVFDDRSQGRLYSVLRQLGLSQCNQRARPIQGLGDAGQFVKVETAHAANELAHLPGELFWDLGDAGGDDVVLALDGRVVDPEIEAAALQRIVD